MVTDHRGEDVVWTRQFLGERWGVPATALGWSEIQPIIEHLIAYPQTSSLFLGGGDATKLYRGSPYINSTIFRHLLFKLPGAEPFRVFLKCFLPRRQS